MSQALYRKYRSRSLDEVLGQDHVTGILRRALEQGKIAHAYLLTGPRGVGKTSVARILAHEINHLPYDDDSSNLDFFAIYCEQLTIIDATQQLNSRRYFLIPGRYLRLSHCRRMDMNPANCRALSRRSAPNIR